MYISVSSTWARDIQMTQEITSEIVLNSEIEIEIELKLNEK